MKKLVLLSGGLDSVVAAHQLKAKNVETIAFSISSTINGRGTRELKFARATAKALGMKHIVLDMNELGKCFRDNNTVHAVGGSAGDWIQCLCGKQRSAHFGVHVMITAAMMAAMEHQCSSVVWGLHKDDLKEQTDDSVMEIIGHFNRLAELHAGRSATEIELPFIHLTKAQVARLGVELGVDLDQTYSCSAGKPVPCGECEQCQKRADALRELEEEREETPNQRVDINDEPIRNPGWFYPGVPEFDHELAGMC